MLLVLVDSLDTLFREVFIKGPYIRKGYAIRNSVFVYQYSMITVSYHQFFLLSLSPLFNCLDGPRRDGRAAGKKPYRSVHRPPRPPFYSTKDADCILQSRLFQCFEVCVHF